MESRAAMRVGAMVLVGLSLFIAAWAFFSRDFYKISNYTITVYFDDTRGLLKQTPVRMNGVTIGEVNSVDIAQNPKDQVHWLKPVVKLAINKKYTKRIPLDSKITITSSLLIANTVVDITPGKTDQYLLADSTWPENGVVKPGTFLAQLSPEANETVTRLNHTLAAVCPPLERSMARVEGILNSTNQMMVDLQATSHAARGLVGNPKLRRTMDASLDDLQVMTHETRKTAVTLGADLRAIVKRNGTKFDELASNAVDTLQKLGDTVDAARSALTRLTEQVSDPRIQQSLIETLEIAEETLARFNQIATDIHQITGDQATQGNIKAAIASVRETSGKLDTLTEKIGSLVGVISSKGKTRLGIGAPQVSLDFLMRGDAPHFRSDVGLRAPFGNKNAFDLGIYDFGDKYRLNAQYESNLIGLGALRYGIYAGKLGVGIDTPGATGNRFSADIYDPNNLKLNARGYIQLNSGFGLWMGADSLFRRTTPLIGLRYAP